MGVYFYTYMINDPINVKFAIPTQYHEPCGGGEGMLLVVYGIS
jgi:hypothetical protein